jgi:hypothetical protein
MPTSDAAVREWMQGYLRAWTSNDPADITALFTEDATYRTDPWSTPAAGHPAIVALWLEHRDEPGTWGFEWQPVAIADDLAIVQGETRYDEGTVYSNLWLIRLAPDGRATEFTEWWMDQSDPS